ncbi:hypothetical protein POTOM_042145 [Populus tomentosa]|uniref:Uncharacterized protein n=1 Tax=Populus tomentosa TaxID=118781 RepID=A0A8X7YR16_POPTO|nr:hypothetical protein POTOM_042145 [Populus tomentosa]
MVTHLNYFSPDLLRSSSLQEPCDSMQFNFLKKTLFNVRPSLERRKEVGGKVEEKFPKDADLIVACQRGLSWTDQQRAAAVKEGWGYLLLFSARLVGVFLVADALFIGAQQVDRVFRI